MFNIEHEISVLTIWSKNEFYRFIDISHNNMSIVLYRRHINGNINSYILIKIYKDREAFLDFMHYKED
jgi:hypothetical protein